jgi:hypothetical protein
MSILNGHARRISFCVILLLAVGAIQESPVCFMWFWRALREAPLQIWYNFLVSSTDECAAMISPKAPSERGLREAVEEIAQR